MSVKIWDVTAQVFKDAETPKIYDNENSAWKDSIGMIYDNDVEAWKEVWNSELKLNFGDGSLNTVNKGYNNNIYKYNYNEKKDYTPNTFGENTFDGKESKYTNGNFNKYINGNEMLGYSYQINTGTLTIENIPTISNGHDTFTIFFYKYVDNWTISELKINLDYNGNSLSLTLKELVENSLIKPIVILMCSDSIDFWSITNPSIFDMYNGGILKLKQKSYCVINFMPIKNIEIKSITLISNKINSYSLGGEYVYKMMYDANNQYHI